MRRLVRIDLARRDGYRRRLAELVAELRRRYPISRAILFGSFARGEEHEGSDIDLVVVGSVPGRFFDRIARVMELSDLPVEPWVYTDAEWEEMVESGNAFAEEVLETGVDL